MVNLTFLFDYSKKAVFDSKYINMDFLTINQLADDKNRFQEITKWMSQNG